MFRDGESAEMEISQEVRGRNQHGPCLNALGPGLIRLGFDSEGCAKQTRYATIHKQMPAPSVKNEVCMYVSKYTIGRSTFPQIGTYRS
jgi:hypothetical protein